MKPSLRTIPVVDRQQKRKGQSAVIHLAIIGLGLLAGYFYYAQFLRDSRQPETLSDIRADDNLSKFRDLGSLDFKVLTDPGFRILKVIGEIPVKAGATGRTDIFAPF